MLSIDSASRKPWYRVVIGNKDQAVSTPQVHRELAGAIACECVAVTGQRLHVLEGGCVHEESQTLLKVLPVATETAFPGPLLGASFLELLIRPIEFDDVILAQSITLGVIV